MQKNWNLKRFPTQGAVTWQRGTLQPAPALAQKSFPEETENPPLIILILTEEAVVQIYLQWSSIQACGPPGKRCTNKAQRTAPAPRHLTGSAEQTTCRQRGTWENREMAVSFVTDSDLVRSVCTTEFVLWSLSEDHSPPNRVTQFHGGISSCARGDLGWMSGEISLLRGLWSTGTGCPGQWSSHHTWRS